MMRILKKEEPRLSGSSSSSSFQQQSPDADTHLARRSSGAGKNNGSNKKKTAAASPAAAPSIKSPNTQRPEGQLQQQSLNDVVLEGLLVQQGGQPPAGAASATATARRTTMSSRQLGIYLSRRKYYGGGSSSSCLQEIKARHGTLRAFLKASPRIFTVVAERTAIGGGSGGTTEFLVSPTADAAAAAAAAATDSGDDRAAVVINFSTTASTIASDSESSSSSGSSGAPQEREEDVLLLEFVVEYLRRQQQQQQQQQQNRGTKQRQQHWAVKDPAGTKGAGAAAVSCAKMGGDLSRLPFPSPAAADAATTNGGSSTRMMSGSSSSTATTTTATTTTTTTASCLQEIKRRYGSLGAFLESHGRRFRLVKTADNDVLVSLVAGADAGNDSKKAASSSSSNNVLQAATRPVVHSGSPAKEESIQQQQLQLQQTLLLEGEVVRLRKALASERALREEVTRQLDGRSSGPIATNITSNRQQEQLTVPSSEVQKRMRKADSEKRQFEKLLASEKRLRGDVERLWKDAESEHEQALTRLQDERSQAQQQLASERQRRKQVGAEKRQFEKLLASEQRHRAEVERLYKEAEEDNEQSFVQLQDDLAKVQRELTTETELRRQFEAEKNKAEKMLASEKHLRGEVERLYNEANADHEKKVKHLQRELSEAQLGAKTESQRRKRLETELLKTENLLSQSKDGTLVRSKLARQANEIQHLQEQLKKERRMNAQATQSVAEESRVRLQNRPGIHDFISAALPSSTSANPVPRILKKTEFPVDPPPPMAASKLDDDEHRYDGSVNDWAGGGKNKDLDARDSEIAVVISSYGEDEVRVSSSQADGSVQIVRSLSLSVLAKSESIVVDLQLLLPKDYPAVPLEVSASLASGSSKSPCCGEVQKCALDAIPNLLQHCRLEALAGTGGEVVLQVLTCADQWAASFQGERSPQDGGNGEVVEHEYLDRRDAELLVLTSAYSQEEVRVIRNDDMEGAIQIVRLLSLPVEATSESIIVELHLSLPSAYPEESLQVEGRLADDNTNCSGEMLKCALNLLPGLVELCRFEAQAHIGSEAILDIMTTVDEWILSEWAGIQGKRFPTEAKGGQVEVGRSAELCWMLIYTHHIVDKEIIHVLKHSASKYGLGGYLRIGKPGFCLVEGLEQNCESFLESLVSMRTKMRSGGIAKRGSSSSTFCEAGRRSSKNGKTLLPSKICDLEGKDGVDEFQKHCELVGLLKDLVEASKR